MRVIELRGVRKLLGTPPVMAVDNLNLSVEQGELLTLLGPSGCGKTTTLRLIAGFEEPDSGSVLLNGKVVAEKNKFIPPEKRKVGIVFQESSLFPHLTIEKNVGFGLQNMTNTHRKNRVQEMLELTGLEQLDNRYPYELSGGQQQRVALARALAPKPPVVVLDEPFGSLDKDLRSKMRMEIKTILKETGVTSVFVTHDQEEAMLLGDRIGVMKDGLIHQIGNPVEIYRKPQDRFVAEFVGRANFLIGTVKDEMIQTEIGEFAVPERMDAKQASQISVMLRPGDIDLIPAEFGNGTVDKIQFYGEELLYSIKLRSGQLIYSSQNPARILSVGTKVLLAPNPRHLIIFAGDKIIHHSEGEFLNH